MFWAEDSKSKVQSDEYQTYRADQEKKIAENKKEIEALKARKNKIKKENFECFKPYLLDTPNTIIKYKLYKQEYYQLVKYLFPIEYSKGIKAVTDILNNISSSKNETLLVQLLSEKFGISTPISIDDNLIF
jgi:hypothetical protein